MTFAQFNLDSNIYKAITACGYTKPTPVQARSIPNILSGKDVIASAQTGTGKTAAFVLPALHRLTLSKKLNKPQILILTPTRELATQITDAASKYGKFLKFNIVSIVGGMPYRQQLRNLSRPVDIIVATPGRLMDHMENHRLDLSQVNMLILDEADRMLDMGFIDDVKFISKAIPTARQTLLFSATVDNRLKNIIEQLLKDPIRVDLSNENIAPHQIQQEIYFSDNVEHKNKLLQHLLQHENIFKGIIFTATKANADVLADELQDLDYPAAALHGDLRQSMRNKIVERLKRGKLQFIVATDVAARGIDISDVTHVINYDLPKFCEDYVHRIGRTGRAGKSGVAISFISHHDKRHLQRIERFINQQLTIKTIAGLEPTQKKSSKPTFKKKFKKKWTPGASTKDAHPRKREMGEKRFRDKKWASDAPTKDAHPRKREMGEKRFRDKKWTPGAPAKDAHPRKREMGEKRFRDKKWGSDAPTKDAHPRKREMGEKRFKGKKWASDAPTKDAHPRKREMGEKRFKGKRWASDTSTKDAHPRKREMTEKTFKAKKWKKKRG